MPLKDLAKRKEYEKGNHAQWYEKNKESRYPKLKERQKNIQLWFNEYKANQCCKRCGNNDFRVLECHHRDPLNDGDPKLRVNYMVSHKGWSPKRIEVYLNENIDFLCANCHKIVHWELNQVQEDV